MTTNVVDRADSGSVWLESARQAAPIVMGYLPVGAAFGVLAQKTGISLLGTVGMSLIVFAGSAQLIAVAMLAAGMPPVSIIATTFVVNLRHLLMSASLAPRLGGWRKWELALFAYGITDESFAVHTTRFHRGDTSKPRSFLINCIAQASWVVASFLGAVAGSAIPDVRPLGLDYALPAMFIALLTMQARTRLQVLTAGFTGMVAVALVQAGFDHWAVITATIIGATFGSGVESWKTR